MENSKKIVNENLSLKDVYDLQEMDIPIDLLGLPKRINNSLRLVNIDNYSKLINTPIKDLIRVRSFGQKGFNTIVNALQNTNIINLDDNCIVKNNKKNYLSKYDFLISLNINEDKAKDILALRNKGITLEEIGLRKGITRERVRQIENKAINRIVEVINNDEKLINYLSLISDKGFLKVKEIENKIQSENDYIFVYCLKNKNVSIMHYIEKYDGFLIDGDEKKLESIIEQMPLIIKKDNIEQEINKIQKAAKISHTLIHEIITKSYIIYKDYYGKNTLDTYDMSSYIVNERFYGRIKITDQDQLQELANLMDDYFGTKYKHSTRALQARVMDTFILIERGTYVPNSSKYYSIDKKVLDKIDEYINNYKRNALPFEALYNTFRIDLAKTNIINKYILQSLLKRHIGNKYKTSRDYIYKNERVDYAEEVIKYVKDNKGPVTLKRLLNEFDEVKPHTVIRSLYNDKIINTTNGYTHIDNINITSIELNELKNDLKLILSDNNTHDSDDVYNNIGNEAKIVLRKIGFDTPDKMFFLLKAYFSNHFNFSRPYIANQNINIESGHKKLIKEILDKGEIYVKEFPWLKEKNNVFISSFLGFLDENIDNFILVSKDRIKTIKGLKLDDEQFSNIDDILDEFMNGENIKSMYSFNVYDKLPNISCEWTPWLLYSIVKIYSIHYNVSTTSNKFRNAIPLIVRKNYEINENDKQLYANDKYYISNNLDGLEDLFEE